TLCAPSPLSKARTHPAPPTDVRSTKDSAGLYPHTIPGLGILLTTSWMYFLSFFCNVIFDVCLVFHYLPCPWAFQLSPRGGGAPV
ncbi:unnamed protein product, partial [Gulo gulo]